MVHVKLYITEIQFGMKITYYHISIASNENPISSERGNVSL